MKIPKISPVQSKTKASKHGMIRKSSGCTPARILKSAMKGKENALSLMKDNEELVKLVKKTSSKKVKMSPGSLLEKNDSVDFMKGLRKFPRTPKPKDFRKSSIILEATSEIVNPLKASTSKKWKPSKKYNSFEETGNGSNCEKESVSIDETRDERYKLNKKKIVSMKDSLDLSSSMSHNKKRKSHFAELEEKKKRKVKLLKKNEEEDRSEDEAEDNSEKGEERLATDGALFNLKNVKNGVQAFLKLQSKHKKAERGLFEEEQFVYLQVMLASIAASPGVSHRIQVPHSILPENPDICLLTPDLRGKKNDPEEAIDFYQEVLRRNHITSVTEVIPLRKFKKEYSQYEEQRKFRDRFDLFLVDASVLKTSVVTRVLTKSSKCIIAVRPCDKKKKLKVQIEKAMRKVPLHISGHGLTLSIKCGRVGMPTEHLVENIVEVGKFLAADKPIIGGRPNINSVYLKGATAAAIPLYVNLDTTPVPPPAPRQSSCPQPVHGELTTINGASVIVFPSGKVKVIKNKTNKTEAKGKKDEKSIKTNKKGKKNQQKNSSDEGLEVSEDESERDIDDSMDDVEESSAEDENETESEGGDSEEEEEGERSEPEEEMNIREVQSEGGDDEVDSDGEREESGDEEEEFNIGEVQSEEGDDEVDSEGGDEVDSEEEGDEEEDEEQSEEEVQSENEKIKESSAKQQKNPKLKNKNIRQR